LKKQETSVILSFESAVYIRQAVYPFSALRREGEHFCRTPTLCSEGGDAFMTLLETLALLTLLATVSFGIFDIAWKIFNNKK